VMTASSARSIVSVSVSARNTLWARLSFPVSN
jgi:hypothetical protein